MIATLESGAGMAMLGMVVLIGAVVGLVYLVISRRRPNGRGGASETSDRSPGA